MKTNKSGFTLIELLAIIVILAVILVIAVPAINSIIENSRLSSLESSAKLIASSLEKDYENSLVTGESFDLNGNCLSFEYLDTQLYSSCTYSIDNGRAIVTLKGKNGNKFENYVVNNGTKVSANAEYELLCNTGYTKIGTTKANSKCVASNYTISFDTNGGTNIDDTIVVTYDSTYGELPVANYDGYTFIGWYTKKTDGEKIESTSKVSITSNQTLYARWIQTVNNYSYTGSIVSYTVPISGIYKLEVWGAQGGSTDSVDHGGYGGYSKGNISLTKGDVLYISVGQYGNEPEGHSQNHAVSPFGGGGAGDATGSWVGSYSGKYCGGGATDIRYGESTLASRIIVAGGGGGGNNSDAGGPGGCGGGLIGGNAHDGSTDTISNIGATQTTGFSFGNGQNSGTYGVDSGAGADTGAGGGGYYGGLRGTSSNCGGGGGSSFISGHTGCIAISSSNNTSARTGTNSAVCTDGTTDNLCSIHYSGKYFTNTVMIDGNGYNWTNVIGTYTGMPSYDGTTTMVGNTGNGYAKITLVSIE